jgi:NAD(P)-dependent dehydrogenase (short-subunit alcohol dehydrogenase family)
MEELAGKVALITGAGRGLGRALALAFSARGVQVAANDISPINLDETIAQIRAAGGQAQEYIADIASKLALQAMLDQILDAWGRLDILIQHARVKPRAALLAMDEWDWRRTLDVNLTGAFLALQSAGRIMRPQGGGVILNLIDAPDDSASQPAWRASQNGLAALTLAAAQEFRAYNIRVHAILLSPDLVQRQEQAVQQALHLCSRAAAGVTGQLIEI